MVKIPVFQSISSDFTETIILGGQTVSLRFIFNTRSGFWHLDFTDQLKNTVYGIKIVPTWLLLHSYKGSLFFTGDLAIRKMDESVGNDITYDNLGNGWDLAYLTEAETQEWRVFYGLE